MFYTRKTPRAQWHNYKNCCMYFITICTQDMIHYFWEIYDGKMIFHDIGKYCHDEVARIWQRKNVHIHEYIVMPNHVHMLLEVGIFTADMNTGYAVGTDALAGRPSFPEDAHPWPTIQDQDAPWAHPFPSHRDVLSGHPSIPTNPIIKRDNYQWPSLWNIINAFKGNITKYANVQHISFARQSRYDDRIIKDEEGFLKTKAYIKNNVKNRSIK